ncbi:MAG: [FeFe] hydrogenase, group A [bacterium]|nr:[FeFe] hydrogenase, group A [bacterium]
MPKITIEINGKKIETNEGKTVFQIAKENGIYIPSLCYHPDLPAGSSCRLCLAQVDGSPRPTTSCNLTAKDGMKIKTNTPEIKKLRAKNLEFIFGEHVINCGDCLKSFDCTILQLAKEFGIDIYHYKHRKSQPRHYTYGHVIEFEGNKCIECNNCVEACKNQSIGCLKTADFNQETHIIPSTESPCISCGQCIVHCPVGAIHSKNNVKEVERELSLKRKKIVFQFAPSVRVSIGEEFDLPPGKIMTGQIITGLKKLGADWVVDVDLGADLTTYAEALELVERFSEKKNLPMMTTCCPSWVLYVETHHPEFIPNLTSVRSPNMIAGGILRQIFAKKVSIQCKDLYTVSVMPCTAKKHEINRQEMWHNGVKPVDAVLTTRELAYLFKKRGINLALLPSAKPDSPLGVETGSGTIYGSSGGVMEAALRTGYYFITGKNLKNVEIKDARGMKGLKEVEVQIGKQTLRTAVVNGMENIEELLVRLKEDPNRYHYIEIMACPGGCIGGGGQPISTDENIRQKRQNAIYEIDKKSTIRLAHENPVVKNLMDNELKTKSARKRLLETKYQKSAGPGIIQKIIN